MKKTIISLLFASVGLGFLSSCEDMMSTKSSGYLYDEDLKLDSENDSLYSIAGLMTKVQQLGERYVLFGELRGDMVSVAPDADMELQEMSAFKPQTNDTYLRKTDFYAVINHCNWILSKMDPSVAEEGGKKHVIAEEYAAAKLYRAWTYFQLGLAYGSAEWITEPILSLEDIDKQYPELQLDELVRRLIAEVEPYAKELRPNYGEIDGTDARKFFLVPSAFLGDLYLYDGQYDNAARQYWNTIQDYRLTVGDRCIHFYNNNTQRLAIGNNGFINNYVNEVITAIPYSTAAKDFHPNLVNLTVDDSPDVYPSEWWMQDMVDRTYYFGNKNYVANTFTAVEQGGDLRGAVRFANETWGQGGSISFYSNQIAMERSAIIGKYYANAHSFDGATTHIGVNHPAVGVTSIALQRIPHVYLRFAEAVNRLGKPTLAYAIIRYGLTPENVADETKIDPEEMATGQDWLNWTESFLTDNIGTAVRGRGYGVSYPEAEGMDLPEDLTDEELTLWIEDKIVDELAAETAYEGNRFFDLIRIARHRQNDAWFAEKVSRRFDNPAEAMSRLSNKANWFIR